MPDALQTIHQSPDIALYRIPGPGAVSAYIASTAETRAICNDPTVAGCRYTTLLREACTRIFRLKPVALREKETAVVNILRGGLNYGLRDALADAFGWNYHTTCFISAQRARNTGDSESWHITENDYEKVYFPETASLVIGDVVATGTSLEYALQELLRSAQQQKIRLRSICFFTFGGPKAQEILEKIDAECRRLFDDYEETALFYLEGRFTCAQLDTPLSVRLTGTDLVRWNALLAPEFIESQYENPAFPLERCAIYDAGSRAFWLREYILDVIGYWKQNLQFAEHGMTFAQLLQERFPVLDPARFPAGTDLRQLSLRQLDLLNQML